MKSRKLASEPERAAAIMERRLAAIMALDVVGYSRLMEKDEAGTLEALRAFRTTILNPIVEQHGGRIFKHTGDGALIEFASAIDAVNSACEIQRELLLKAAPPKPTNFGFESASILGMSSLKMATSTETE
jgi:class 3 adenylate cyclase